MSSLLHMDSLRKKHLQLETSISLEYLRPLPNSYLISDLKHKKLAIKDELERLALAS